MSGEVARLDPAKEDADLYELYDEWRLAHAELQLCHAKVTAGHGENVLRLCKQLESIEGQISRQTPVGFRGLINTLTVAATILSARAIDPDGYVGSGDAFGLVAAALRAAEFGGGKIGGAS